MVARFARVLSVALLVAGLAAPVSAQQSVSTTDVQRLQESVNQAGRDIAALRQSNISEARRLQAELDELQDEVIYLRVKLRKESSVPRSDYIDIRDRLEDLKDRARGGTGTYYKPRETETTSTPRSTGAPDTARSSRDLDPNTVPSGTELDVRLRTGLNSGTAQVEDRFEATTTVDLRQGGQVVIPAGSVMRGVVTDVKEAGRIERKGSLALSFDQITINGRSYPIRATVTEALEGGGYREDAGKIGTGAAVGGIIGGILGGFKGVLTGILVGGGGVVAATEGEQVNLPAGTVLRVELQNDLTVR